MEFLNWIVNNQGTIEVVICLIIPSLITALTKHPSASSGVLITILKMIFDRLSVLTHIDSPGTLKFPIVTSKPPDGSGTLKGTTLLPLLLLLPLLGTGCTVLTLAEKNSPSCAGLDLGRIAAEDVTFIIEIVSDVTTQNWAGVLDKLAEAKGQQVFKCELEMAIYLLHSHPTLPPTDALARALAMNPKAQQGALQKLEAYRAATQKE